ncbi:hypothetical protein [Candidatus Ichthyocystis hellenicum]|uniref:hypothetical protein n=1 Tax=Candidatus Ichthyocystis hellenicum TaxID=1561003 RepID=UPI000A8DBB7E|nr:hypothetical protein [Candidatus Ichthyocystis hellenicum]
MSVVEISGDHRIIYTISDTADFSNGPHTLAQLSTAVIYGFTCKESVDCLSPLSFDEFRKESSAYLVQEVCHAGQESPGKCFEKHLVQLSPKEAIEAAITVRDKHIGRCRTKYESDLVNSGGIKFSGIYDEICLDDCDRLSNSEEIRTVMYFRDKITEIVNGVNSKLVSKYSFSKEDIKRCSIHPLYQVVHAENVEDIIPHYYKKRDEIIALQRLPPLGIKRKGSDLHYRDPLYFLNSHYALCNMGIKPYFDVINFIIYPLRNSYLILLERVVRLIIDLEASVGKISRKLYNLILAVLIQMRHSKRSFLTSSRCRLIAEGNSSYPEPHERERLIIPSLNMIISLRNYIKFVNSIEEILMPFLELGNFISLEDVMVILRSRILGSQLAVYRSTGELKVSNISLFLRTKYRELIVKKRSRMDYLLGKIDLTNGDTSKIFSFLKMPYSCPVVNREIIIEALLKKIDLSNEETLLKTDHFEVNNPDEERELDEDDCKLVFVRSIIESVKKLMKDVEEMESFIKSLPEEIPQSSKTYRKRFIKFFEKNCLRRINTRNSKFT